MRFVVFLTIFQICYTQNIWPPDISFTAMERMILAEDALLTCPELIKKNGYPVEIHIVTTTDGHMLEIHRIPNKTGKPILIQHGLESSSFDWVVLGPNNSLAYTLHEHGYDVWLGNSRGNMYSQKHTRYLIDNPRFWDFSWDEIARFDISAEIDYILENRNMSSLYYIGHSMGTTTPLVLMSSIPEYNKKVNVMIFLAPIAYMGDAKSPILKLLGTYLETYIATEWSEIFGYGKFEFNHLFRAIASQAFCSDGKLTQFLCTNMNFILAGFNRKNIVTSRLPVIMAHDPAGASTKQFIHYGQEINSRKFRKFDYYQSNVLKYGSASPPDYNLSQISGPIVLIYSDNDWLSAVTDVDRLAQQLPNLKDKIKVSDPLFNHLDYILGKNAPEVLHPVILEQLGKY